MVDLDCPNVLFVTQIRSLQSDHPLSRKPTSHDVLLVNPTKPYVVNPTSLHRLQDTLESTTGHQKTVLTKKWMMIFSLIS